MVGRRTKMNVLESKSKRKNEVVCVVVIEDLGNTSLAQHLFQDERVKSSFAVKSWAFVSDAFDIIKATKVLIESAAQKGDGAANMPMELPALQARLNNLITNRKFLLVFDYVRTANVFKDLEDPLNFGAKGSKILVTSRLHKVAEIFYNKEPDLFGIPLVLEVIMATLRRAQAVVKSVVFSNTRRTFPYDAHLDLPAPAPTPTPVPAGIVGTQPPALVPPQGRCLPVIGAWERGQLLGSGSFGTVYEGITDNGDFFAVKEVSLIDQGARAQQCIDQLEHEISLLSRFKHENIVQYLGTRREETKLYIFLELVTQGSLASLCRKYHLGDSQVSSYTRQILRGLKYLHDQNLRCTDASGSVKLADFGLAKETSKINIHSRKGTAHWMAPEVVNPQKTYGLAADIWSRGCTVSEMLTGELPYADLEWQQALFKIGQGEPPIIPESLSPNARNFIKNCIKVEPDDRPSAADLLKHPFVTRQLPASGVSPIC